MAFTQHGHHIPGSPDFGVFPGPVARCGGPGICTPCSKDLSTFVMTGLLPLIMLNEDQKKEKVMKTTKFVRKSFAIEAVQVTEENFTEVAKWCDGTISREGIETKYPETQGDKYIKVNVKHPLTPRQTKAFVGDWVLASSRGFKVYTDSAFNSNFQPQGQIFEDYEQKVTENIRTDMINAHQDLPGTNAGSKVNVLHNLQELRTTNEPVVNPKDAITGKR